MSVQRTSWTWFRVMNLLFMMGFIYLIVIHGLAEAVPRSSSAFDSPSSAAALWHLFFGWVTLSVLAVNVRFTRNTVVLNLLKHMRLTLMAGAVLWLLWPEWSPENSTYVFHMLGDAAVAFYFATEAWPSIIYIPDHDGD